MRHGSITLLGSAELKNVVIEKLATDPASPRLGQMWFNTTEEAYKFFDGTEVFPFAKGGDLEEYLKRDGSDAGMTGELVLDTNDQSSASSDRVAVSKGHLDTVAATKQDNIAGAASTITDTDLTGDVALVTDAAGKVAESATTSAEIGYVSGVTGPIQAQIDGKQDDLGYVPVNKAGDAMSGNLAFNGNRATGLGAPTDANDAIRLVDLENEVANLNWQDDVLAVQTDDTLDPGASPATGARYIITDSANLNANFGTIAGLEDNDIVEFDGTDWTVAFDVSAEGADAAGTLAASQADEKFYRYNVAGTSWNTFTGLEALNAGIGLVKTGNVIDVNMGAGVAQLPSDEVGIDCGPTGGLYLADPTTGDASVNTDAVLSLLLDGSTLTTSATGVKVSNSGITEVEIASTALGNGLAGGDGVALNVLGGTGITVDGTGVNVDETYLDNKYVNVDGDTLTGPLILAADPTVALEAATKQYTDAAVQAVGDDLSDLEARVAKGYFVYDGTASADASHTVVHNIGQQYVNVTIIDDLGNMIMPDEVSFDDENQLTVTLTQGLGIRVVCMAVAPAAA